jgi:NAD(P)-dependent dehydrogenase (short-subunit alcohol dehydrogenase family)
MCKENPMVKSGTKFIVVTGATRGLGRALVARFVEEGHTVAGCGRSAKGVDALFKEFGGPHRFDAIDVADDSRVGGWARDVLQKFGPPDFLINNAALINRNALLWDVPAAEFSNVIDVNIKGIANVIRHFVPAMVERKSGVIVNFSSGWGRTTSAEVAPYCATKWAVEGLTQAFAQELPGGMAAVALNPGIINTEMLQSCFGENADSYPDADRWSRTAAPFILSMSSKHNGEAATVPM